jgi:hypothetical protein
MVDLVKQGIKNASLRFGDFASKTPSYCSRTCARTHARALVRAYYGAHARTHANMIFQFVTRVFAHASLLWRVARRHSFLLLTHITHARTRARAHVRAHYDAQACTHAKMILLFCNEGLRTCFPPLESGASTLLPVAHALTHARTHVHVHARTMAHMHARMQK